MLTIVLHGTADPVADPINGEQVVRQWLRTNQLASHGAFTATFEHPISTTISPAGPQGAWPYTVFTWQGASEHDVLDYWLVEGIGHAWSGGSPERPFTDSRGPNASLAMYQSTLTSKACPKEPVSFHFFLACSHPSAPWSQAFW